MPCWLVHVFNCQIGCSETIEKKEGNMKQPKQEINKAYFSFKSVKNIVKPNYSKIILAKRLQVMTFRKS